MQLFYKYNLWNFISIYLSYLLKDFIKDLEIETNKNIKISILKDKDFSLKFIKNDTYYLIKNNIVDTTSGKLRFLINKEDLDKITNKIPKNIFLELFGSISSNLQNITNINEIKKYTITMIDQPELLGNPEKYFVLYLKIKSEEFTINLLNIIREEMLLFSFGKVSSDFALNLNEYSFKKAFIELDKKIIWDGMNLWGPKLIKALSPFIRNYPAKKYNLIPGDDSSAYRLLLQYLLILKLKSDI